MLGFVKIDCTESKDPRCNNIFTLELQSLSEAKKVREVYVSKDNCKGNWNIKKPLGKGAYGQVFETCCDKDCDYVLKKVSFTGNVKIARTKFEREVQIQQLLSLHGLAPIIYQVNIKDDEGSFIMKAMKSTLQDTIEELLLSKNSSKDIVDQITNLIVDDIFSLLDEVHKLDIYHHDTHLANFMYDKKWQLIDFGEAEYLDEAFRSEDIYKDYTMVYTSLKQLGDRLGKEVLIDKILENIKPYVEKHRPQTDERGLTSYLEDTNKSEDYDF